VPEVIADHIEIPLFEGKNSKNACSRPFAGQNSALQAIDSMRVLPKFRYAAEQRNFSGPSGELNRRTAELQRNLSGRISFGALSWRKAAGMVPSPLSRDQFELTI
jgi:hypothetical protein